MQTLINHPEIFKTNSTSNFSQLTTHKHLNYLHKNKKNKNRTMERLMSRRENHIELVLQSFPRLWSEIKSSTERTRKTQTNAKKSKFLLVSGRFLIQWLSVPPSTAHDALLTREHFQNLTVLLTDPTVWTQTELQQKYLKIHFAEKSSWQRTPAFFIYHICWALRCRPPRKFLTDGFSTFLLFPSQKCREHSNM